MKAIFFGLILSIISINLSIAQVESQNIRVDFQNPEGFTRHLLLGFVPDNSATDGLDYGYDALNINDLEDDLNWIIEDDRYVIQGVGAFDIEKYYPLGMFLENDGDIEISLNNLENFEEQIDVYLYDLELDTFTLLNEADYVNNLSADTYLNRFYLTFSTSVADAINEQVLSLSENEISAIKVWQSNVDRKIYIKNIPEQINEAVITLYSIDGKKVKEILEPSTNYNNSTEIETTNLSQGVYLLQIKSSSYNYSTKVCIAK